MIQKTFTIREDNHGTLDDDFSAVSVTIETSGTRDEIRLADGTGDFISLSPQMAEELLQVLPEVISQLRVMPKVSP